MSEQTPFQQVVEHFDGIPNLCKRLGITQSAVSQWGGQIPPLRAFEIEKITRGKFKADDIKKRPRKKGG